METSRDKLKHDFNTPVISKKVKCPRKHKVWTIAEVRNLIDGVSQYGVGKWTEIKRLLFSSSAHRTPVDLKVGLPCLPSVIAQTFYYPI